MSTRELTQFLRPRPEPADVVAGASVALVLIPQAMAYAELAGMPPQVGLFASALPLIFAALFVSSFLQTGPAAVTGLLAIGALEGRAAPFTEQCVELAILLALVVGVSRLAVGVLCLGSLAYLLSSPALTGFTTAQRYSSLQARSCLMP
jgi:SulP family sulfate permease